MDRWDRITYHGTIQNFPWSILDCLLLNMPWNFAFPRFLNNRVLKLHAVIYPNYKNTISLFPIDIHFYRRIIRRKKIILHFYYMTTFSDERFVGNCFFKLSFLMTNISSGKVYLSYIANFSDECSVGKNIFCIFLLPLLLMNYSSLKCEIKWLINKYIALAYIKWN